MKFLNKSKQRRWEALIGLSVVLLATSAASAEILSGRVIDAEGQPVAGARIHASQGLTMPETSNEDGRFHLDALPAGFVSVVALHTVKGVGTLRPLSGGSEVIVALRPFTPPLVQDRARAEKILSDLVSWAAGDPFLDYSGHWAILAPFDLKRAEEKSRKADGSLPESFILSVITLLGRDDIKAALEWGLPRLDDIESPALRNTAMINLGKRVADSDPALANDLYERATVLPDIPEDEEISITGSLAFELALRLKRPEVPGLIEKMLKEAKAEDAEDDGEGETYSAQGHFVGTVAEYDFPRALQLLKELDEAHQPQALSRMINVLLRGGNLYKARELLEKLADDKTSEGQKNFSTAAIKIVLSQGKIDPAGALKLARRVNLPDHRPEALAAASLFQEEGARTALLQEAAVAVSLYNLPLNQLVNIALLAGDKFPELKVELTKQVLQRWEDSTVKQRDAYLESTLEKLVVLIAAEDRLKARALLELEWTRIHPQAVENSKVNQLQWIAFSMALLDFERALEMARSIPQGEMGFHFARYRAEHGLARRLLIGPEDWQDGNGYSWNRLP